MPSSCGLAHTEGRRAEPMISAVSSPRKLALQVGSNCEMASLAEVGRRSLPMLCVTPRGS
uniref:Uncharacterized protein n=1 Tax=Hyaloperonospora arabidopsidis (strain Emoy2) TaxID=559515 RepID=M4B2D4_HYAAE